MPDACDSAKTAAGAKRARKVVDLMVCEYRDYVYVRIYRLCNRLVCAELVLLPAQTSNAKLVGAGRGVGGLRSWRGNSAGDR